MSFRSSFALFSLLTLSACTGSEDFSSSRDPLEAASASIEVAFVLVGDNGVQGPVLGCGDSLVVMSLQGAGDLTLEERVTQGLKTLFAIREQNYGEPGYYNALYQSQLTVDSVSVSFDKIAVGLSGSMISGGICDDPRIVEQIKNTILENVGMDSKMELSVTVNGESLEQHFNAKGN